MLPIKNAHLCPNLSKITEPFIKNILYRTTNVPSLSPHQPLSGVCVAPSPLSPPPIALSFLPESSGLAFGEHAPRSFPRSVRFWSKPKGLWMWMVLVFDPVLCLWLLVPMQQAGSYQCPSPGYVPLAGCQCFSCPLGVLLWGTAVLCKSTNIIRLTGCTSLAE